MLLFCQLGLHFQTSVYTADRPAADCMMYDVNIQEPYSVREKCLSFLQCAVYGQATLWGLRDRCLHLFGRKKGVLVNIPLFGECRGAFYVMQ